MGAARGVLVVVLVVLVVPASQSSTILHASWCEADRLARVFYAAQGQRSADSIRMTPSL